MNKKIADFSIESTALTRNQTVKSWSITSTRLETYAKYMQTYVYV